EGVETEEQVAALQSLGIDLMQGFYFSGALSISQVCQYQPPARSAVLSLSGV
ncbi:MAG TPA: EAL domain-containing protein, partial [Anaerolineae bacterium]|nr:EAL domain-containing protein [Anaerolineae bacterium]